MQVQSLVGQTLLSIRADAGGAIPPGYTNPLPPRLWSGPVDLLLTAGTVQVQPCEVPEEGRYPSLGIEVCQSDSASASPELAEAQPFLPARITDVRLWDSLGEGPVSAVDLVLDGGVTLTIRHVYPPMTLGIDIWPEGRHAP